MAKQEKKMSFEEALCGLEQAAEILKKEDTTLEAAMKQYEEGLAYFQCCNEILSTAKQKIQVFEQSSETLKDFSES